MLDPAFCGSEFSAGSWTVWRDVVARLYDGSAADMTEAERGIARELTGRNTFPDGPLGELYIAAGRRSGKSRFASLLMVHAAAQDFSAQLAPGEVAVISAVAPDRRQAGLLVDYCRGLIEASPVLREEVIRETGDTIAFRHRTEITVHTGTYRAVRGFSMALSVIEEAAYLRDENSATPDIELARALRPALATLGGRLVVISSPHRKTGLLWQAHQRHFGEAA
jgi:hypothetical protein